MGDDLIDPRERKIQEMKKGRESVVTKNRQGANTGQVKPKSAQKCVLSIDIVGRWAEPDRSNVLIVVLESELAIDLKWHAKHSCRSTS